MKLSPFENQSGIRAWTVVLVLLAALTAPLRAGRAGELPADSLRARARVQLGRHVDAAVLSAWRDTCGAEVGRCLDDLFAWLPAADLSAWRAPQIEADIRLALTTRHQAAWRDSVSDDLFDAYVLPHRVAQEPIASWRAKLHDLLQPRVRGKSLYQAALETNRFCREYATYIPTSSRDQNPLMTMDRGLGRCEEEEIFYICAARSVGIPARPCFTPWWMAQDNNHAWVEVWTGSRWHYLGACEPAPDLDQAWFTEPARRAGCVLSVAYGQGSFPAEDVYKQSNGVTLINSTPVYNRTGTVRVEIAGMRPEAGRPPAWPPAPPSPSPRASPSGLATPSAPASPGTQVHLHVFNSGCLVELASFPVGRPFAVGPGDYVVALEVAGRPVARKVTVTPGVETVVRLDAGASENARLGWLEKPFELRIPHPAASTAPAGPPSDPLVDRTSDLAVARRDLDRLRGSRVDPELLARILPRTHDLSGLLAAFDRAGTHAPAWASLLDHARGDTFRVACSLLMEMDDKDFLEADTAQAAVALRESMRVRAWRERHSGAVPDSVWISDVLSPRIDEQPADLLLWRQLPWFGAADSSRPEAIHALLAGRLHRAEPTHFGHVATPSESWASTWATPRGARVALVGLLRRNGIPARVDPEGRWVDCWTPSGWVPADPLVAGSWNRKEGEAARAFEPPAHLDVSFLDQGALLTRAEWGTQFRLTHLVEGKFTPLLADLEGEGGRLRTDIEPGDWWLFGGQRDDDGNPRLVARHFHAVSGQTVRFSLEIGRPRKR